MPANSCVQNVRIKNDTSHSTEHAHLTQRRKAFTPRRIEQIVEQAAAAAKIQTHVTPHTFRRSMATEMLNRGVREEVVSTLLGHASTQTTRAAYARLSIQLAQEVNQAINGKPL